MIARLPLKLLYPLLFVPEVVHKACGSAYLQDNRDGELHNCSFPFGGGLCLKMLDWRLPREKWRRGQEVDE